MTPDDLQEKLLREAGKREGQEAVAWISKALRLAHTPADFERIASKFQHSIDRLFKEKLAQSGDSIDCKAGCHFCCTMKVDAFAMDIFLIVDHLQKHLSPAEVQKVQERAKENAARILPMTAEQEMETIIECPLLQNNRCICYAVRPVMCRKYHSPSASNCEVAFSNPRANALRSEVMEVQFTCSAAILFGIKAFDAAGFDSRAYSLSAGLNEALSNPKCFKRWRSRARAFSDRCVANEP